jgi:hypothetical protein
MTADPSGAILARARRLDAGAIVLADSRRRGMGGLVRHLLTAAGCPVVLVPDV